MARRNHSFEIGEFYHCYNRGTDKRKTFLDNHDFAYFLRSLKAYSSSITYGKLRLHSDDQKEEPVIELLTYCLLPNHFHLVLKQLVDNGVSKFMQRVGIGYSMYFNEKYKRSGSLFQGTFKSTHLTTDQDLRQVMSYVYHNNVVHNIHDENLFRHGLNNKNKLVRDLNSNLDNGNFMSEVVDIIKKQRLSLE